MGRVTAHVRRTWKRKRRSPTEKPLRQARSEHRQLEQKVAGPPRSRPRKGSTAEQLVELRVCRPALPRRPLLTAFATETKLSRG